MISFKQYIVEGPIDLLSANIIFSQEGENFVIESVLTDGGEPIYDQTQEKFLEVGDVLTEDSVDQLNALGYRIEIVQTVQIDESKMPPHLKKKKKDDPISFTHHSTGQKITGRYGGAKRMGAFSYAVVHTDKGSHWVPYHQVHKD